MRKLMYSLFAMFLFVSIISCEHEEVTPVNDIPEQTTDPDDPLEEDKGVKGS